MVIERALEKVRQAAATKQGTKRVLPREPAASANGSTDAAEMRPTFPRCECDLDAAVAARVLLPESPLTNEGAAAAYRMIRTRLLNMSRVNNLRSISITSPAPGDGKSLTSINLALSMARDPHVSVFLLDLDLRKPSICRYLGVRPPVELLDYFSGTRAPADVLFSIGPENLAIAGSMASTEGASELLGGGKLEALLSYINSICSAPIILMDLPPLLVTDEALLIAPRVDTTLLVVSEGRTRRDNLNRAIAMLSEFKCAGIILNRASAPMAEGGYYYGYK
jgi:protein-tyrosine kinase